MARPNPLAQILDRTLESEREAEILVDDEVPVLPLRPTFASRTPAERSS
jgi:hypothetical protein